MRERVDNGAESEEHQGRGTQKAKSVRRNFERDALRGAEKRLVRESGVGGPRDTKSPGKNRHSRRNRYQPKNPRL